MLDNQDKMYLLNLKIDFWQQRLEESRESIEMLADLKNQGKIDSNLLNIENYTKIILALEKEKNTLTNQG